MAVNVEVRIAGVNDAGPLLEMYRPYVERTAVSFELDVPTVNEFAARIQSANEKWLWLVAEIDNVPVGYAYGSAHRPREAYRHSVETSAYVHDGYHRQGIASTLYSELLSKLAARGYRNAYAGVSLPNDASLAFHRGMGFEYIGVFPQVGNKFDQWHDVAWLHKPLSVKQN
jgi:phosphinothricin acetyltransferase